MYIIERLLPLNYYSGGLIPAIADQVHSFVLDSLFIYECLRLVHFVQEVLKEIMTERHPDLATLFDDCGIDFGMITFNWFMTLFVDPLPPEVSQTVVLS